MPNPTPKRRGRPPGPPKEPKPKVRMGRPTVWAQELGHTKDRGICAPEGFFEAWKDFNFRKRISDLTLDFLAEK